MLFTTEKHNINRTILLPKLAPAVLHTLLPLFIPLPVQNQAETTVDAAQLTVSGKRKTIIKGFLQLNQFSHRRLGLRTI